ncbi:hypothetical protein AAHE18_13G277900 [Arachis hypogaea]
MGLSSKQVSRSSSGLDWNQALLESQNLELPIPKPHHIMKKQQQNNQSSSSSSEPMKCPRCESTNTKFCYYNNYNKSQPRYLCRTCKRHWTKGGTLRNVPVGGGRKNKRVKKSTATATATATATTSTCTTSIRIQAPSLAMDDHKNIASPSPSSSSSLYQVSVSTSLQSTNVYNNCGGEEFKAIEEPSMHSIMATTTSTQPWEIPAATMEMSNYWGWEDIDSLVSTDPNNNHPWDDSDIKP